MLTEGPAWKALDAHDAAVVEGKNAPEGDRSTVVPVLPSEYVETISPLSLSLHLVSLHPAGRGSSHHDAAPGRDARRAAEPRH